MGTLQKDVTDIHANNIRVFVSLLDVFQTFKVLIYVKDLPSYSYRNMKHNGYLKKHKCYYRHKRILLHE